MKPSKYGNKRITVDGVNYASRREAQRSAELKLLERAGHISGLRLQPRFPIIVNGLKVCTYVGDFAYRDASGAEVVEDAKGFKTDIYKLKRKLVKALFNFDIVEV